jgi:hypothetical protein
VEYGGPYYYSEFGFNSDMVRQPQLAYAMLSVHAKIVNITNTYGNGIGVCLMWDDTINGKGGQNLPLIGRYMDVCELLARYRVLILRQKFISVNLLHWVRSKFERRLICLTLTRTPGSGLGSGSGSVT